MSTRTLSRIVNGAVSMDGAGVKLIRLFGYHDTKTFDPFLMLDAFGSDNPDEYVAGFPWHPHRGIETVTIMLEGAVEHADSLGNKGVISSGDVQWMTAGSGIIHQEMPLRWEKPTLGFQLWVNLPRVQKMGPPRYQDIPAKSIPSVNSGTATIRIIAGTVGGVCGPVQGIAANPELLDISLPPDTTWSTTVPEGYTCFAAVHRGSLTIGADDRIITAPAVGLCSDGDVFTACSGPEGAGFLLAAGRPLHEPIAWQGPIVMNTQEELEVAFREYHTGTFVKR